MFIEEVHKALETILTFNVQLQGIAEQQAF